MEDLEPWLIRLREVIDSSRIPYKKVSIGAECSPDYVSKVLNGKINPTVDRLLRVISYVGGDPAYVFSGRPVNDRTRRVLDAAAELTENEALLAARLIESARSD